MKKYLIIFLISFGCGEFVHALGASIVAGSTQTWTATVIGKLSDNQGNQIVSLHFSGDQGGAYDIDDHIPLGAPSTQLSDFVAGIISNLNAQGIVFSSAPAIGQTVTPTPTTVTPPDPNATIKAQFLADYLSLRQCKALINNAVLTAADLTCTTQQTTVNSEFAANRAVLLPLVPAGP